MFAGKHFESVKRIRISDILFARYFWHLCKDTIWRVNQVFGFLAIQHFRLLEWYKPQISCDEQIWIAKFLVKRCFWFVPFEMPHIFAGMQIWILDWFFGRHLCHVCSVAILRLNLLCKFVCYVTFEAFEMVQATNVMRQSNSDFWFICQKAFVSFLFLDATCWSPRESRFRHICKDVIRRVNLVSRFARCKTFEIVESVCDLYYSWRHIVLVTCKVKFRIYSPYNIWGFRNSTSYECLDFGLICHKASVIFTIPNASRVCR